MRDKPILGKNLAKETRCTRMKPGGPCFQPGAWHIIWEGNFSSVACGDCGEFARQHRESLQIHPFGPSCTDPQALWYEEEGACRRATSPEDVQAGRIIFDQ